MVNASDILRSPSSKFAKKDVFEALLSAADAAEALEDDSDPDANVSLAHFARYRGVSRCVNMVQRIATRITDFQKQEKLLAEIKALADNSVADLSDPTRCFNLRLPSDLASRSSPGLSFVYVGRPELRTLLEQVRAGVQVRGMRSIDYSGPPGRGKSYILAALGQHLVVNDPGIRLVYIVGEPYASKCFEYFRRALLLAYWREARMQAEILAVETLEDLISWCSGQENMAFFVDEANFFDNEKATGSTSKEQREAARRALSLSGMLSCTVWCASTQSTWATYKGKSNEEQITMSRPFNAQELTTWLMAMEQRGQLKRGSYSVTELLYFTGYIPRLLASFAARGKDMKDGLLRKMLQEFYKKLADFKSGDISMLEQVLSGGLVPREVVDLDPAFFSVDNIYTGEDNCRVWCASPYLERKLREKVGSIRAEEFRNSLLNRIEDWSAVIHLDAGRANPARMGWMVEGLILDALQTIGTLDGMTFKHSVTYHQGMEGEAVSGTLPRVLKEGVLFIPSEFNTKAIDAAVVKLEAGGLMVLGVQITVAPWKRKEETNSHAVWLETLWEKWTLAFKSRCAPQRRFVYILSDAVRAAKAASEQQDAFRVLKFSDVHQKLAFIDEINLPPPEEKRQCNEGQRCNRFKIQVLDDYYCQDHHQSSSGPSKKAKTSAAVI